MVKKKYTKMVCVLLTEETYRRLIKAIKEKESSISAFVREILETQLNENPIEEHTQ
jgi:predicted DNA-binding protein